MKQHWIILAIIVLIGLVFSTWSFANDKTTRTRYFNVKLVEPRTIINNLNTPGDSDSTYRISESGSYFLADNLVSAPGKCGIEIAASQVTLDMNGFDLDGEWTGTQGICFDSFRFNIVIKNGSIRRFDGDGISGFKGLNVTYRDLSLIQNRGRGIDVGNQSRLYNCFSNENDSDGFRSFNDAIYQDCTAYANDGVGINHQGGTGLISNCIANSNDGGGIAAFGIGNIVRDSAATSNGGEGIRVGVSSIVRNNTAVSNMGHGINTAQSSRIHGNVVVSSGANGLNIGGNNVVTDNLVTGTAMFEGAAGPGNGLANTGSGNVVKGNSIKSNGHIGIKIQGHRNFIASNNTSGNVTEDISIINKDDNIHGFLLHTPHVMTRNLTGLTNVAWSVHPSQNGRLDRDHENCFDKLMEDLYGYPCGNKDVFGPIQAEEQEGEPNFSNIMDSTECPQDE